MQIAENIDLKQIKQMYKNIIKEMYKNNIKIWNNYYPLKEFKTDIKNNNFYILKDENNIKAGVCIYLSNNPEKRFNWEDPTTTALYICRLGVNTKYLRQGIATNLLKEIETKANEIGIKAIRLTVAEINKPAIKLYKNNGYKQTSGKKVEFYNSLNSNLTELGFEKLL